MEGYSKIVKLSSSNQLPGQLVSVTLKTQFYLLINDNMWVVGLED